jgi:hypothetical protein
LQKLASFGFCMPQSRRYLLISLGLVLVIGLAWVSCAARRRVPEAIKRGYSEALDARAGHPGAARVVPAIGPPGLSPKRRVWLHAELPNYPSPVALKLADADLQNESPEVRMAAIKSMAGWCPAGSAAVARAVAR